MAAAAAAAAGSIAPGGHPRDCREGWSGRTSLERTFPLTSHGRRSGRLQRSRKTPGWRQRRGSGR